MAVGTTTAPQPVELDPMSGLFGTYDESGEPVESSSTDFGALPGELTPLSSVNLLAPISSESIDTTLDPSTSAFNPTEILFSTMGQDLTGNVMAPDLSPPPDAPPSNMPVPGALGTPGTQASDFGTITGLGNPFLIPILLTMQDRYTSVNPFDPAVQPGSPDATQGVTPISGGPVVFPEPGQPLPPGTSPPFIPVPTIDTTSLPGALPPVGHANFEPGQTGPVGHSGFGDGGFGGGGGGGGGGPFSMYIPTGVPLSTWANPVNPTSYRGMPPASTMGSASSYDDAGAQARQAAVQTGQPVYIYDQWGNIVSEVSLPDR